MELKWLSVEIAGNFELTQMREPAESSIDNVEWSVDDVLVENRLFCLVEPEDFGVILDFHELEIFLFHVSKALFEPDFVDVQEKLDGEERLAEEENGDLHDEVDFDDVENDFSHKNCPSVHGHLFRDQFDLPNDWIVVGCLVVGPEIDAALVGSFRW